ncbi:MAG: hypothetical protein K2G63_00210, partial [Oscillospiraceae bacterium]|nr:hypothetical protein [Oscillospiraceae bacterium]
KRKIYLIICKIISDILTVINYINSGEMLALFLILTILFVLITAGFYFVSSMTNPERDYNNFKKNYVNSYLTFIFDDDKIITSQSSDSCCGSSEFKYDCVKSVEKINDFFIIKLNQNEMIVFREDEITEGSKSELIKILKDKSGINLKI